MMSMDNNLTKNTKKYEKLKNTKIMSFDPNPEICPTEKNRVKQAKH